MRLNLILFSDVSLRLASPLSDLSYLAQSLVLLIAVTLFGVLVVRIYRNELRHVGLPLSLILLTLRFAAIIALCLILLFNPILVSSVKEEVKGRVLVALDCSDSMTVSDTERPLVEKLKLGKLLRLTTHLASEYQHDHWIQQLQRDGSVRFDTIGGMEERKRFNKVVDRLNEIPRLTIAERILNRDGLGFVSSLETRHDVNLVLFGNQLTPIPAHGSETLESLERQRNPNVDYTDLKLPLAYAIDTVANQFQTGKSQLLGVVLLTDGQHNWGESPVNLAAELGRREVPIFPIVIAHEEPPADLAVVAAKARSGTVFKGSTVLIEAEVRVTRWPAGPIRVMLSFPENFDQVSPESLIVTIEHDGLDKTYPVMFRAQMDTPGQHLLRVSVETQEADRFPENNSRLVRVNVVKDRARVMLIDGENRWEFHYLHTALGRDPNMDVRAIVFRQPRIGAITDDAELRRSGTPATKLPDDTEVFSFYDCIVLGDIEPTQFTQQDWKQIEKYVSDAGGTLVLSAGKRAMPLLHMGHGSDTLRKLLPIRDPYVFESQEGFSLEMTEEASAAWFLSLGDNHADSLAVWNQLPRHYWAAIGHAKDGAEVLAVVPGGQMRERVVIARQNYGFGRVLYVGIDSTWRWRFKIGDNYHHRFWGQVTQWAASDRLLPVTNASGTIQFGTREPVYTDGQKIQVVVRSTETIQRLSSDTLKRAQVIRLPDELNAHETPISLVTLTHPEGQPRDLIGTLPELTPGRYAVELDIPEWSNELHGPPGPDGRNTRLRSKFEIIPPDNKELVDVAANLPLLEELAQVSGGKVYTLDAVNELLETLSTRSAMREYIMEKSLRMSWWTFAVIIGLLTCEWGLRKWAGLL
jgi:hypothetical protein